VVLFGRNSEFNYIEGFDVYVNKNIMVDIYCNSDKSFFFRGCILFIFFFSLMVSSLAQAQDSSQANLDSLLDSSAYSWYDSVHTLENVGDLPIDQDADDLMVYSFDSLLVGKKAHDTHPGDSSTSCTDDYNISFATNTIWYVASIYESLIKANMAWSAEESATFVKNLKYNHRIWCDCISTNYGYNSHLCEE